MADLDDDCAPSTTVGHGEVASNIAQYATTYQLLLYIGLAFGIIYLVLAPAINKLMHGVK